MPAIDQSSVVAEFKPDIVEIYAAGDAIEAHAAAAVLQDEGIEVQVVGEMLGFRQRRYTVRRTDGAPTVGCECRRAARQSTAGAMADADIPAKVEDIGRCIPTWREADFCRTICVGRLAAHRTGNV